jgi:hypothetical protein
MKYKFVSNILNDIKKTPKKYTTLFGGIILMSSLSSIASFANITPYFISYLRENVNKKNLRYSESIYIHTSQLISSAFTCFLISIAKSKLTIGPKQMICVGTIFSW